MEGISSPIFVAILIVVYMLLVQVYESIMSKRGGRKVKKLEKQIFAYCKDQGFRCEKIDGNINITRRGTIYRVFLYEPEKIKSVPIYLQYATFDEELQDVHWIGLSILANQLNEKYTQLSISFNLDTHSLWAHYRADVHGKDEFAEQFNRMCDVVGQMKSGITEVLPRIKQDFPASPSAAQNRIGFE